MARRFTLAADIADLLARRKGVATTAEICADLETVRRAPVLKHSVRSAIYQHLETNGDQLFERVARGQYRLKNDP